MNQKSIPNTFDIPNTLDEALISLERVFFKIDPEERRSLVEMSEEDFMVTTHHGIGQWIRNNWGLWHGSPLRDAFEKMGIFHADDMSGIILTSFYRKIHDEELDVEGQVTHYKDFWKDKNT